MRIFIPSRQFNPINCSFFLYFPLLVGPGCSNKTISDRPLPPEGFQARLSRKNQPATLKTYQVFKAAMLIKNNSPVIWPSQRGKDGDRNWIRLAYRWYDLSGTPLNTPVARTNLPYDLGPQQRVEVVAKVVPPERQGEYFLEFDMLQEGVDWFKSEKSPACLFRVKVEEN